MSKSNYDPLQLHLAGLDVDEWATTFTEIESLLGFRLPKSARAFNAWWSNSLKGPSGTVAWRHAGFRASVKMQEERVIFRRGLERPLSKKALRAAARASKSPKSVRASLMAEVKKLYDQQGVEALSKPFLKKAGLYYRLASAKVRQAELLEHLGIADEYGKHRGRIYAGRFVPRRTFEEMVEAIRTIAEVKAGLPTMEWFRKNGHSGLITDIFRTGHSWEEVRSVLGDFASSHFRTSRIGIRWRSQPEASFSDFLYARGIRHRRGERYDAGYAEASGRHRGHYDVHFATPDGREVDVEIWGDLPDKLSDGRYASTRAAKERWNANNPNFLGIQYVDCLSDARLTAILEPFIGVIEPFRFEKPQDPYIEASHWTDSDELLKTCRQLAAQQPDGLLPNESWMRKRGRYADREGPAYNTLAVRINQWLGGTRRAREFLGQAEHSTEDWTPEKAIAAWRKFEEQHGVTPTQATGRLHRDRLPAGVLQWGQAIRGACVRYGVLDEARRGRSARRIKWTADTLAAAWVEFNEKYGVPVNLSVGKSGAKYPRSQLNEASRIYSAALRLGLVDWLKGKNK
jgi:hypothetical protein